MLFGSPAKTEPGERLTNPDESEIALRRWQTRSQRWRRKDFWLIQSARTGKLRMLQFTGTLIQTP